MKNKFTYFVYIDNINSSNIICWCKTLKQALREIKNQFEYYSHINTVLIVKKPRKEGDFNY